MKLNYSPIEWLGNRVKILDQTRLPQEEVYLETDDYRVVASAIKELKVRGAPAIGVAGAYGIALGALASEADSKDEFVKKFHQVSKVIAGTRPTARNLFFAVERMEQAFDKALSASLRTGQAKTAANVADIKTALVEEAVKIHRKRLKPPRN